MPPSRDSGREAFYLCCFFGGTFRHFPHRLLHLFGRNLAKRGSNRPFMPVGIGEHPPSISPEHILQRHHDLAPRFHRVCKNTIAVGDLEMKRDRTTAQTLRALTTVFGKLVHEIKVGIPPT